MMIKSLIKTARISQLIFDNIKISDKIVKILHYNNFCLLGCASVTFQNFRAIKMQYLGINPDAYHTDICKSAKTICPTRLVPPEAQDKA